MLQDGGIIQKDLDRIEKWTNRNLIKFDEDKCIGTG